ncbi:hypothetical protein [Arthrobacter sp. UYCo732]|uniref:hypothetical protein n=1 Tax=Arthrobacter sp. UYCo732 TaxID=3156336 RepID=UPI00339A8AF8
MNAYYRQLQSAIEHLDNINPMFDFAGADPSAQARQLKTWWGKALADDHLHGHDPSGPITVDHGQLTDRQLVLLSALQRGARGVTGDWAATAGPEAGDALALTVTGHGLTVTATAAEVKTGVSFKEGARFIAVDGSEPAWPPVMLHRTTNVPNPVAELVDLLAVSTAFAGSPFAALHDSIRRTSYDAFEAFNEEFEVDWNSGTATPSEQVRRALATAAGMTEDDVPGMLGAVLNKAASYGHSVPEATTGRVYPDQQASTGGPSSMGAAILAGLGIDVGDAQVIGIPAGGSMSIGIGVGPDGLTISDLPVVGAGTPAVVDPEEAFLAECAASLGLPTEVFRGIVQGDEA